MTADFPRVSVQDVLHCSFPAWYPLFEKISFKSVILNLTDDVLQYLRSDDFYLPTSANVAMENMRTKASDSDDDWSDEDDENETTKQISFPEFEEQIQSVLDRFDAVFPKLNWSSPKDARWVISDNRLKCRNLADIFLLLKSSDFITHDLCEPFKFCHDNNTDSLSTVPYVLVLRKWSVFQPSKEFRCFVRQNEIIAISQRDNDNYYEHIQQNHKEILADLLEFFSMHIQNKFPSNDFVVDIYRKESKKMYIIDFNPWGQMTDSLLFDWNELLAISLTDDQQEPEFRYVDSQNGVKPSGYTQYAMPKDIADISRERDVNRLADIIASQIQVQQHDSDTDDDTKT